MTDKQYDKILEQLRKMHPEPSSAQRLTNKILASLPDYPVNQNRTYLQLRASHKQWLLFNGFRIVTTAAAMFLLVFFVFEQRMITNKLNRLESQVTKAVPDESFNINTSYGVSNVMDLLPAEGIDTLHSDVVFMSRKSLDYLLERIRQLENENTGFRERLNQLHSEKQKPNS